MDGNERMDEYYSHILCPNAAYDNDYGDDYGNDDDDGDDDDNDGRVDDNGNDNIDDDDYDYNDDDDDDDDIFIETCLCVSNFPFSIDRHHRLIDGWMVRRRDR